MRIRKYKNKAVFNGNTLPAPGKIFPGGREIDLVILYKEVTQALTRKRR